MPSGVLVSQIEGRVIEKLNEEVCIKVGDDENDVEYVSDWIVNCLPDPGTYVSIIVMSYPGT